MVTRFTLLLAASLAIIGPVVVRAQDFETVAHWKFEDGANFLNDSSGNGYHLEAAVAGFSAPTFSTDKPASALGNGSAQFSGASFAQTVVPLVLSGYDQVRFSYWMKVETTQPDRILFEHSFDTNFQVNAGSSMHIINPSGLPDATVLIAHRTGPGFPSAATTLDLAFFDFYDQWHFVQLDYNFTEPVSDERIKVSINNIEGSTYRSISDAHEWARLRDDLLYVGGRREFAGDPSLLFTGKITDVKIEAVLPPSATGDYNGNGIVDAADYAVWRDTRGSSVPNGTGADGNSDGMIDDADYLEWQRNFGSASGSGSAAAVPEPATWLLCFIASLAVGFGCR